MDEICKEQMARLSKYCSLWGGSLIEVPEKEYDTFRDKRGFYEAPFTGGDLGVRWGAKKVFYSLRSPVHPVEVIHEMGHVFASKKAPNKSDEFPFLGWEYRLAMTVGILEETWFKVHRDYVIEDGIGGRALGDLTRDQRAPEVQRFLALSEKAGLFKDGHSIAIR